MADPNTVLDYSSGQLQVGAGDLEQCTKASFNAKRSSKVNATLRRPDGAGIIKGPLTIDGSASFTIDDQTGTERNWLLLLRLGTHQDFVFKDQAGRDTIQGTLTEFGKTYAVGEGVVVECKFIGILQKP